MRTVGVLRARAFRSAGASLALDIHMPYMLSNALPAEHFSSSETGAQLLSARTKALIDI
jgi:hypothetical protein